MTSTHRTLSADGVWEVAPVASLPLAADLGGRKIELEALSARCEREEPSRELDSLIARSLETLPTQPFTGEAPFERLRGMYWVTGSKDTPSGAVEERWSRCPPYYTASLDAAVTLVPSDFVWAADNLSGPRAYIVGPEDGGGLVPIGQSDVPAKTVALAICAAALRARAALAESHSSLSALEGEGK